MPMSSFEHTENRRDELVLRRAPHVWTWVHPTVVRVKR